MLCPSIKTPWSSRRESDLIKVKGAAGAKEGSIKKGKERRITALVPYDAWYSGDARSPRITRGGLSAFPRWSGPSYLIERNVSTEKKQIGIIVAVF